VPQLDTFYGDEVCHILEHWVEPRTRCAMTRRLLMKPNRVRFPRMGAAGPIKEYALKNGARRQQTAQSTMLCVKD
jgi:hypothetical protein